MVPTRNVSSRVGSDAAKSVEDNSNVGLVSGPSGRDFGDLAGYGSGGSAQDYRDVVGENLGTTDQPNPLNEVVIIQTDEAEPQGRLPSA